MIKYRNLSPLRYPGGKAKVTPMVVNLIKNNMPNCDVYIEPFSGGSGVAIALLLGGVVNKIVLNDLDKNIYAFWHSVLYSTDELVSKIRECSIDMNTWHQAQIILNNSDEASLSDLGFATFFLNRTNVAGILTGGVIGGKDQAGKYRMDCRFGKESLIDRILSIAAYRSQIELYNLDTLELIDDVIPKHKESGFIFFDPPYVEMGSSLYMNYFKESDHVALKDKIASLNDYHWIVTYDNVELIHQLYKDFNKETYKLNYSANQIYKATEVIIYSNKIKNI